MRKAFLLLLVPVLGSCATAHRSGPQSTGLSFFITSNGPGNGANLGGLAGADAHCRALASAVGAGDREWHAYLSLTGGFDFAFPAVDRPHRTENIDAGGEPLLDDGAADALGFLRIGEDRIDGDHAHRRLPSSWAPHTVEARRSAPVAW